MKRTKILVTILMVVLTTFICVFCFAAAGCDDDIDNNTKKQSEVGNELMKNQPFPTDIEYSLERYNIIRRAYWVNGQREKAINLPCSIAKPLGYIVLISGSGAVVGRFIVDGKVSSLKSYLSPETSSTSNGGTKELPDVDGCYGTNVDGIFFFTTNGNYIEWNGTYIYSDIPFTIEDPILHVGG